MLDQSGPFWWRDPYTHCANYEKPTGCEPAKHSQWLVQMMEYTSMTAFTAFSLSILARGWGARLRGFVDSRLISLLLGIVTLLVAGLSSVTTALIMGD